MANEKLVTLEQLDIVKNYIDVKDSTAIKSAEYVDNKICLYTTADKSGTAAVEINLPEEMFLDQAKTTFEPDFAWTNTAYPNTTNPGLNGKPVLVLAVRGDNPDVPNYSFVSLETLIKTYEGESSESATVTVADGKIQTEVKVSAEEGNALSVKTDGLFVAPAEKPADLVFATDEEVRELFATT